MPMKKSFLEEKRARVRELFFEKHLNKSEINRRLLVSRDFVRIRKELKRKNFLFGPDSIQDVYSNKYPEDSFLNFVMVRLQTRQILREPDSIVISPEPGFFARERSREPSLL